MLKTNANDLGAMKKEPEFWILILVCSFIALGPLTAAVILSIRKIVVLPSKLDVIAIYGCYLYVVLRVLKPIISRFKIDMFILPLIVSCLWAMSFLFHSMDTELFIATGTQIILTCIPFYIIARCVKDFGTLKRYLSYMALLITLSMIFRIVLLGNELFLTELYSQSGAYDLLPAIVISMGVLFDRFSFLHLLNIVISGFIIFSMGARGPLLCIVVYIALKTLLKSGGQIGKMTAIIAGGGMAFYIYHNTQQVLVVLQKWIISLNLSDRLVSKLLAGTFLEDTARNQLFDIAKTYVLNHPLIGTGIISDRLVVAKLMGERTSEAIGWYPHNIVAEIMMQFGIVIGAVLLSVISLLIGKALLKESSTTEKDVVCIFVAIGIVPLMVSESYITNGLFFALMGLCVNIWTKNRRLGKKI